MRRISSGAARQPIHHRSHQKRRRVKHHTPRISQRHRSKPRDSSAVFILRLALAFALFLLGVALVLALFALSLALLVALFALCLVPLPERRTPGWPALALPLASARLLRPIASAPRLAFLVSFALEPLELLLVRLAPALLAPLRQIPYRQPRRQPDHRKCQQLHRELIYTPPSHQNESQFLRPPSGCRAKRSRQDHILPLCSY